uniref:Early light-inducible protein ELIP n=1 Tax=Zea mays TaxID=4577 RepID=Q94KE7_MAIZE|nr:early light-inducible protein ELIP [Zea mays]
MATTVMASATASSPAFSAPGPRQAARLPAGFRGRVAARRAASCCSPGPPSRPMTLPPTRARAAPAARKLGLWDALAFSGPAPERINGRLAMVGFVSALAVEATRGDGILSPGNGAGLAWFAYTAAVLSAASLVPLLQGESAEGRSGRFMTADAELWNGRFAMLGLVALAVTEYLTGAPFVNV